MAEDKEKVVEKYYIEVGQSNRKNFLRGLVGGLGWALGISLGTAIIAILVSLIVKRIDVVPIFGQFIANVIKAAQQNLNAR